MRYALGDDWERGGLPKVGGWVFLTFLPLVVAILLAVVVAPLGWGGSRMISIVLQIASARTELLPILIGSQLGVSALVVAMTQFRPERWRGTPKELGDCWLREVRLVASQENRYKAASVGLACISSIVVFGVAACVSQRLDAGGILLLVVVWGVHAVSSVVLIMMPMVGVADITDYWESLTRLACVAEMWSGELEVAKKEIEGGGVPLVVHLKRWRGIISLTALFVLLMIVAIVGRSWFNLPTGVLLQVGVIAMLVDAAILAAGAGHVRWSAFKYLAILFWPSWIIMALQAILFEIDFVATGLKSFLAKCVTGAVAAIVALPVLVVLFMLALGVRCMWGRFDFLRASLRVNWVADIRSQCRYGIKCSTDEREAIERSFVRLANQRKEGLAKSVKESVLLPFVSK
jgi:membrane protein